MEHDPVEWVGDPYLEDIASEDELEADEQRAYERWNRRDIPTEIWSGGRRVWTRIANKVLRREDERDVYWSDYAREVDAPQKIRLIREHIGQGRLYQGRMQDSLQFQEGVHFHLGHSSMVEVNDKVVRVKYTISDGSNTVYDWQQVMRMLDWAVQSIKAGHDVLVTCDMGASRSVTFAAMVVAVLDGVAMDYNLRYSMRNPRYDDPPWNGFLPNELIWKEARVVVEVFRGESFMPSPANGGEDARA